MAQRADTALTGVQMRIEPCVRQQWVVAPIVVANAGAKTLVERSASGPFDPRVFIRRNRLRCQLAADPVGFFGQNHCPAQPQR